MARADVSPRPWARPPARTLAGVAVARSAVRLATALGHGGSVIGGQVMLAVDRDALSHLRGRRAIALVSGTNGKTTTTAFLAAAVAQGRRVTTNEAGANLETGIASTLALGDRSAPAVLEVDEAVLPGAMEKLRPDVVVLLNLSRDQLDRYGEVRTTAACWRNALRSFGGSVVANADDPLVVWPALATGPMSVQWVAVGDSWTGDAAVCPACGHRVVRAAGDWSCTGCPLRRPTPDLSLGDGALVLAGGPPVPVALRLPGRCNLGNAAMAVAAAVALGVDPHAAAGAIGGVGGSGGRYRVVTLGDTRARLLLAKNPASWLETLQLLQPAPVPVLLALNAEAADGRDPSWLWDVPFELLGDRPVWVTGKRAADMAVRLHYAGVAFRQADDDPLTAVRTLGPGDTDVIANYTAFRRLATLTE